MSNIRGKRTQKRKHLSPTTAAEQLLLPMVSEGEGTQSECLVESQPSQDTFSLESSASLPPPRFREAKKKNYTDHEMEVLVDEVLAHRDTLFGSKNDKIPMSVRNAVWTDIVQKVNSLGIAKRTVPELKKKWGDIRKKVKWKLALLAQQARQTGGGPRANIQLTPLEEKVSSTYSTQQIEGIGTIDVCTLARQQVTQQEQPAHLEEASLSEGEEIVLEDSSLPQQANILQEQSETQAEQNFIPNDMGLSEVQRTFLTDYMQQHLALFGLVSKHLQVMEACLQTIATAVVGGMNNLANSVAVLAQTLQTGQSPCFHVPAQHPTFPVSISGESEQGVNILLPTGSSPILLTSPESVGCFPSPTLGDQNSGVSAGPSTVLLQSPTPNPLDLSLPLSSNLPAGLDTEHLLAGPSTLPVNAPSFLMSCKKELAMASEQVEGSQSPGLFIKAKKKRKKGKRGLKK